MSATAAEPTDKSDAVAKATVEEIRQAITSLDSEQFATRDRAAKRLEQLVDDKQNGTVLADEFSRAILSPQTSFEVRSRLGLLSLRLPAAKAADNDPQPAASEIAPLLDQINNDSIAVRDNAERKLRAMLKHDALIGPILVELKRRLAEPSLDAQGRKLLEPLLERTREAWVVADAERVPLPAVSTAEMTRWLDILAQPEQADSSDRQRRVTAERELADLIVRDDTRDELLRLLEQRIAGEQGAAGSPWQALVESARPAMAAEVWGHAQDDWEHRQHITLQHLIVGVPQFPENAQRATHFDRIDDKVAHCVSGSTLSEGNYPVGVAIPNPHPSTESMFYLVNLPTPRRQLAYEYYLKRPESERLLEISRRTLDDFLANRRVLDEKHVVLLALLDPRAVSAFAGQYFQTVPNQELATTTNELVGQLTVHGAVCHMLARVGTREAVPALEQMARAGKLGKINYDSPFQIDWIALLTIARRDPWPEVDAWLAGLVRENAPLVHLEASAPELGAGAAALLLERHSLSPRTFGLEPAGEAALERLHVAGYRFTSEKNREQVLRWWDKQKPVSSAP